MKFALCAQPVTMMNRFSAVFHAAVRFATPRHDVAFTLDAHVAASQTNPRGAKRMGRIWPYTPIITMYACLALFLWHATRATAQHDPTYRLDEVSVTAERRERNLLRAPLSITALPAEELDTSSIDHTFDLQNRVPGLNIKTNAALGQLYLRGVGSDLLTAGADPAVATFVDGVYQSRAVAALQDLFDVERVEILKGPQGTLFGRNTTGGAIHILSREPTPDLELEADTTYGNFNALRLRAVGNVPVVADRLFFRLSGLANRRDGYVDNLFLDQDQDDERTWAVRGQALLYATDSIEILVGGDFSRERDTRHISPHPNAGCCMNLGIALGGQVPDDPRQVTNNIDNDQAIDAWGLRARLIWDLGVAPLLGRATLTSLTAYRVTDASVDLDLDATDVDAVANRSTETSKTFTQEIQLASETDAPLEWLIGLYALWEDVSQAINVRMVPFDFLNQPRGKVETQAWAVFGQASYWLSQRWRLTAGLRYSMDRKRLRFRQTLSDPAGQATGTPGIRALEDGDEHTWGAVTPKFGLEYFANEQLLLYASATRGFKSGGFNTTQFQSSFDPEFIWSYELGFKASLWQQRARLSIAGFYYDYDDVQILALPAGTAPGTFPTIINAAQATVKGIDVEIAARPLTGLAIDVNLLYLDARFDNFEAVDPNNPSANPDRAGGRMPQAPQWTTFAGTQYSWHLGAFGVLTARAEYRYQSSVFFNAFQDPLVKQDGYGLVNARLQFDSADGRWTVAVFGNNLTDELYAQNIIRQEPLSGALQFWGAPRTYGGQVGFRF